MAGGIFVDRPFHPNPKCTLFAAIAMGQYWFAPAEKNVFILPVIFVFAYVGMAFYDFYYNCDEVMRAGSWLGPNTLDSIFKPQGSDYAASSSSDQEVEHMRRVYLFHLLATPLLAYVGLRGSVSDQRVLYGVLLWMGVLVAAAANPRAAQFVVYHGLVRPFRLVRPRRAA